MPFGFTNAASTFQGLMNSIFKPFLGKCVLVVFDDLPIYKCCKDHVQHVDTVLKLLEEISMDFISGLPKSKGKSVTMVVIEKLTKNSHFYALSHSFKASLVSTAFMETIQKLHGNPNRLQVCFSLTN